VPCVPCQQHSEQIGDPVLSHGSHQLVRDAVEGTIMVGDVVHQNSHVDWERETVMVLLMVVGLMGIGDVGGVLYVAAIIVKNLAITSMKKTIVVMWNRLLPQTDHLQVMFLVFLLNHHKVNVVLEEIIMDEDVVLRRIHAAKEKVIVTAQVMEDRMMEIEDVGEILCVAAIIVNSLACTSMTKMTVVKGHLEDLVIPRTHSNGVLGVPGLPVTEVVVSERNLV